LAERFELQQKQVCVFMQALPAQTQAALDERLLAQQGPLVVMHDASERAIPRPVDKDDQQAAYSGKKKQHTVKNAFVINTLNIILFVGATVMGSVHDKKLADTQYDLGGVDELWQDTGYQGYKPVGVSLYQPIKKPRGKELSVEQKAYNQAVSRIRVQVEHVIGSTKRYRIVKDECRLRKGDFVGTVIHLCAGLHNFRVTRKPVLYPNHPKPKLT
jgi:hypothetical protein